MEPHILLLSWQTPLSFFILVLACRAFILACVIVYWVVEDWRRRQKEEAEWIARRFAMPPLELTPKERASGWQVMCFDDGAQCKMLSDVTMMRKLCGSPPFAPPEPYVFESELAKQRARAAKWSPHDTAEDLARRREALKDYEF